MATMIEAQEVRSLISATIKPGDVLVVVHDVLVGVKAANETAAQPAPVQPSAPEPVQQPEPEPEPEPRRRKSPKRLSADRTHILRFIGERGPISTAAIMKLLKVPRTDVQWRSRVWNTIYRLRFKEGKIRVFERDHGLKSPRYVLSELDGGIPEPTHPANGSLEL